MDNDDCAWPCTQAVVYNNDDDDQPSDKRSNFGRLVLNNLANNKCYVLQEGDNTIGRHPSNYIYIEHPSISMHHAVIQCDADGVVLLDKGSLNKTRLNKRNLKKDVAYFLDEDVLLMFGEVPANYYVEGEPVIACDEISVQRMSKENNDVSGSKSLNKVNASLVNENSSTSKMKTIVFKTEPDCTNLTLTDVHIEQNSSSPIDEVLLEAISQIEANENNINSIKTENSNSRDSSPSPVMDLTGSVLLEPIKNTLCVSKHDIVTRENEDIVPDLPGLSNRVMPEKEQEDICSPEMDLGSSLSDQILNSNQLPINVWQSPNKINTREDTPSPVMDLGLFNNSENKLSTLETYNPNVLLINKCTNEVEEFEETQMFDSSQKILISNSSVSENQKQNETTFEQHNDIFCADQSAESGKQPDKSVIGINSIQHLSGSPHLKPITNKIVPSKNSFCNKNKMYNDSFQNISTSKFHTTIEVDGSKLSTSKKNVNTFEADDDEIFSYFIQQESKSQTSNLISVNDEDFFNCPTQKISPKKNNLDKNDFSARHGEDTQTPTVSSNSNKTNTSTFSMPQNLTQLPEIENDDFFNFPTQKISFSKKNNSKISSTICKEETNFLPSNQLSTSTSTSCAMHTQDNTSQVAVVDSEDYFNCPTQKISVSNKINVMTDILLTTHKEESQKLSKLPQSDGSNTYKTCDTQAHVDVTEAFKIDENDIFNCPTQKISVPSKINIITNRPLTIHKEESQKCNKLPESNVSNTFKTCDTQAHEDVTQAFKLDENDFFNCPTQKISNTNKDNFINRSLIIHKDKSQKYNKLPESNVSKTSKTCDTQAHEDDTQAFKLDEEDFFNCPTQKISVPNKINLITNRSLTTHKDESQKLLKFPQSNGSNTSTICDIQAPKDVTETFKVDEEDFFNCPTQKISNTKKENFINRSLVTHKDKSQKCDKLPECNLSNTSKTCDTQVHEDDTQAFKLDENDFFNCPTQKISNTNKDNFINRSLIIHKDKSQKYNKLPESNVSNTSKTCDTQAHEDDTQAFKLDEEDFFNCPTQKISVPNKMNLITNRSLTTHRDKLQKLLKLPQSDGSNTSKICDTQAHEDDTQAFKLDEEDFFNCPTQKISVPNKINLITNRSLTTHKDESQKFLKLPQSDGSNTSKFFDTQGHKDVTETFKVDEEDFFNCPTQKILAYKNISLKAKLLSTTVHREGPHPNKTITNTSKTCITGIHKEVTPVLEMNNEDFFINFPSQIQSTSKKINLNANVSSTSHEEDKQLLCKKNSSISSLHQDLARIPSIVDENFFDCPTQKISISKKIKSSTKISSTTYREEIENLPKYLQPDKPNKNTSSVVVLGIDDEEFFNCPTQKLSTSKENCSKVNVSSIIHEEETQKPTQELSQSNKIHTNVSRKHKVLTRAPKIDEKEFFNCTTQKLLTSKNSKASSITHEETQLLLSNKPIIGGLKISDSTREHDDSNRILETNDEDFFNCPTQKVLLPVKTKSSMNVKEQETNIVDVNEAETQDVSLQINGTMSVSRNCSSGKNKWNNDESNKGECKLTNKKKTVIPDNENNFQVRKSTRLDFKLTSKLNIQPPITLSKNESLAKSPNIIKEPIIRVRNDLHLPGSVSKLKKKTNKLIHNILPMSTNTSINLPSCSKTPVDKENDLTGVSIKQEPLINDSIECQNIQHKRQSNLINETIFSPLNIPDERANSLLEQSSSLKRVENNVDLLSSNKLSNLSNDASKWQLFWNKKKMSSQNKEKGESSNNKVVGKTDRYQTRAITKRENTIDLSRKRKQDVSIDDSKRKLRKNDRKQDIFNTSTNSISEVVVTFSYLRNRHLQEMKQFVEKTGGSITDEITQCTVLVTDKIRCTMKILSAIARGCPIVDANWLKHSYTVNEFQDVNEFIIVDKDAERKYRFRLKESLARAQANRLLNGYNVLVTPSVKPGPKDMKVIINCAGGNYVVNWPKTRVSKELIVTCNQDRHQWKSIWDNSSAVIIDEDILVMSIIRQKLNV